MLRRYALALLLGLFALQPAQAQEPKPIESLQPPLDEAIAILKDPRYRSDGQKGAQRDKLWELIRRVFDFEGITERAVGRNWKRFSPQQQKDFTEEFTQLLGNSYLTKIQGEFKNERVEFLSQEQLADGKWRVKSKIIREVDSIPVDYSARLVAGKWRVYDVNIEGVSLVQNYRSQFDQILSKDSPDALIERVRTKNKTQEKEKK